MKIVLRILNVVIMTIAGLAAAFLFIMPSLTFNSNIAVDVGMLARFVPDTEYSEGIDIVSLLGTDTIHVGVKFELRPDGMLRIMKGDREIVNKELIAKNINGITGELEEPIDLITEYFVRVNIKKIVEQQIYEQVDAAREKFANEYPSEETASLTTEDIMDSVGIDDEYFTNFAYNLYTAADQEDATIDSVSDVLFEQVDEALARAEDSNAVNSSDFTDDAKAGLKENLAQVFNQLNLVNEDGTLKRISQISYVYLTEFLKSELSGKVSESVLAQKTGETLPDYSKRLIAEYVYNSLPDMVYQIIGYVGTGFFVGMFVFAAIWGLLLIITLIKTFTRKPWTVFGVWFWIMGGLQVILGIGLTVLGKFVLPKLNISQLGLPIKSAIIATRTYLLIPSILFGACIVLAIIYAIFKHIAKSNEAKRG